LRCNGSTSMGKLGFLFFINILFGNDFQTTYFTRHS
jgi:hypothetical protein